MNIDWDYVEQKYQEILTGLTDMYPVNQWSIEPVKLVSTNHKTKYGMADINGVIFINQAFVGTTAYRLLEATLRHEFAHLYVGLNHKHNTVFKAAAKEFKAKFGSYLNDETVQINEVIGYKYQLFAKLDSKQELLVRKAHRKHAKYLKYKPGKFRYLTINGQKVISFRYQDLTN